MKRGGFTLIELSIVLVIIGLIVGGVLVGRDLIKAAEIRAQMSQFEKFDTALRTFTLKYGVVPGDITIAQGTQLGLSMAGSFPGNNDGLIKGYDGTMPMDTIYQEPEYFFINLSDANLIDGKYYVTPTVSEIGTSFPKAKLGNGGIVPYSKADSKLAYFFGIARSNYANVDSVVWLSNAGIISPIDAFALDTKLDDGSPTAGGIRSATVTAGVPAFDTSDGNCSTASTTSYNVTRTTLDCRLIVAAR